MNVSRLLALAAILPIVVAAGCSNNPVQPPPDISIGTEFKSEGNLVKDNPGMTPSVWYLIYEEPGKPAALAKLIFLPSSICLVNNVQRTCDLQSFTQGQRVSIEGELVASILTVDKLYMSVQTSQDKSNLIRVTSPSSDAVVASPLNVEGQARGNWYFEASFPVKLLDANGKQLAIAPAQAQGEWMKEDFVPFKVTLTFPEPTTDSGTLILEKDNPSGLPQNADELRIPVKFDLKRRAVQLYYYNSSKDQDATGNILCSKNGLVAVKREIPNTKTPIQDTINLLLQGKLTAAEKAQGISTEYPLAGVELKGAALNNGTLTLEFADPQNKTGGGSCRVGVLWYQIEATAKQFPEVKAVKFMPDVLFQP